MIERRRIDPETELFVWMRRVVRSKAASRSKHIGLMLVLWLNRDEAIARPGIERLAYYSGTGERTVRRAVKDLERRGFLSVERRHRQVNRYAFTVPLEPDELPEFDPFQSDPFHGKPAF